MKLDPTKLKWYQTVGVSEATKNDSEFAMCVSKAAARYLAGDWGEIPEEDKKANDCDIERRCGRVLARYNTNREDIYIITDGDFETTTVLFCREY